MTRQSLTLIKNKAVRLIGAFTVLALAVPATHSTASAQGLSSHIEGSWIMTNKRINQGISFTAVGSFSAGGAVLFTGAIAGPPLLHGSWARTEFNRFDSTVYFFAFDPAGNAVAMIKTNQTFQLKSRDELVGSGVSLACDLKGEHCQLDPSVTIEISGRRIVPEKQ